MRADTLTALLSGTDLALFRGDRCLFTQLEFALNAGEMLLVEGANGSGKTSLLRAIAGLLEPERGQILWRGEDTRQHRQAFHAELVWMAHRLGLKGDLTLVENLRFDTGLRRCNWDRHEAVLDRLGLTALTQLPLRSLSAGQQRRVSIARTLLSDASLWLLDEPFTNLDAAGQALVVEVITEHLTNGGLCVVASHQQVQIEGRLHRIRLQ